MKKRFFFQTALMVALVTCFIACGSDESCDDIASQKKLTINVFDTQGFTSSDATPQPKNSMTRALPAQYEGDTNDSIKRGTVFEMGDAIGIYEVDGSGNITAANIPYYFTGQVWDAASAITFGEDKHYFAYFPYQETPEGAPALGDHVDAANLDDAAKFFSSVISGWTVIPNQQSYDNYKASDLMVGKGAATITDGNTVVNFQMKHQFGLVVFDLGQVKHMLRSGSYYWFDMVNRKCKSDNGFYVPSFIEGEFRAIIPLDTKAAFCATDEEWAVNASISQAGHYQRYKIGYSEENPDAGIKYFELRLGDVYYNDGSLLHVTDDNFDERMSRQADAEGVVVFVSDGSAQDQRVVDDSLDTNGMLAGKFSHGLVLRIVAKGRPVASYWKNNDPAGEYGFLSYAQYRYWQAGNQIKKYYSVAAACNDFNGRRNTSQVIGMVPEFDNWYNSIHPGPSGDNVPNSGWYVPGMGQIVHSMVKCEVMTDSMYNVLTKQSGTQYNIEMKGNIWRQYMYEAVGATSLVNQVTFSNATYSIGLWSSTFYPAGDAFSWSIGLKNESYYAKSRIYVRTSNSAEISSDQGYTPMMLSF